jgi:hypothetical protein
VFINFKSLLFVLNDKRAAVSFFGTDNGCVGPLCGASRMPGGKTALWMVGGKWGQKVPGFQKKYS